MLGGVRGRPLVRGVFFLKRPSGIMAGPRGAVAFMTIALVISAVSRAKTLAVVGPVISY